MKNQDKRPQIAKRLQRPENVVAPQRTILIVCEGTKTEPKYLQGIINTRRLKTVRLEPARGTDPTTLVNHARDLIRQRKADAEQSPVADGDYEEVWCVLDVDEHQNLLQALHLAADHGVKVAISNPCFEYWLILHFERYGTTNQTRHKIRSHLKQKWLASYKKGQDYCSKLIPLAKTAVDNSAAILKQQWSLKEPIEADAIVKFNPSTLVHVLVRELLNMK